MAPIVEAHHHRSTTKAANKPFKSRHASKGFIKDLLKGKVEDRGKTVHKSPQQQVMSKIDRRHQARQKLQAKHRDHAKATSIFSGHSGAPRIVAIVPLTENGNSTVATKQLCQGLDIDVDPIGKSHLTVHIDRFKQSIQYLPVQRDLLGVLDACRVADFVIFILSAQDQVDETGEVLLRSVESQGVSNVITVVHDLESIDPPKRRPQIVGSLKSYIGHFFPDQEKIYSLGSPQDNANVIRSICTSNPKGVRWREDRSWMLVEDIQWQTLPESDTQVAGNVVLTGVVRGRALKANRLVHVGDWGTFQVDRISAAYLPYSKKRKADEMKVDDAEVASLLDKPDNDQDDLAELAPEDVIMGNLNDLSASEPPIERKGVLLDDHHYFTDEEAHLTKLPKRLPRGTSAYQAAWYLGDVSDSGSDDEDILDADGDLAMDAPALPQDGVEGIDRYGLNETTEVAMSEYPQSEIFHDPTPQDEAEDIAAYRSRKKEAVEDLEFPDEIELHPNVIARERLARYRGLKSLRSSKWETEEDRPHEPEDWNRLLQVGNYKGAKNRAMCEALVGGVTPGTRVSVHLRGVPQSLQARSATAGPITLFSLLRHEKKLAVMNFSMTLSSDCANSIKAKEELIMQCGFRRLVINPVFSQTGNTPNNVHKFDRYLHPGRTAVATVVAPLTWGSVPTLFFKRKIPSTDFDSSMEEINDTDLELIGTGTSQPPDQARVIAKRVILTGHPYKIHKKLVTVRYMFFNTEDVNWFKALQLWTKRGRSGYIKESLGTHGYFKATFDAKINPQDSIGVSLYKRVFPRRSRLWNSIDRIAGS